ncbi:MAG: PHP domain-containing protein [Planctomycetes bacterium]|nr:PHP domain-containing protein [Planctomycetota bacterium]
MSDTRIIDLHMHSTASDGSLSPEEVARAAKKAGLAAISLTDHDTIAGYPRVTDAARALGVEVIPGVEISVNFQGQSMHMLGYGFDLAHVRFRALLEELSAARRERNEKIIARLRELGVPIVWADVVRAAGGDTGNIGRPHFANAMLAKGAVKTFQAAFDRYLGDGKPAYFPKEKTGPEFAIDLIHQAGGLAVFAHPVYHGFDLSSATRAFAPLKAAGLDGVEVYYSDHTKAQREIYLSIAHRFDLLVTGGSDFHGENNKGVEMGSGRNGNLRVPYDLLAKMKGHLAARSTVRSPG